MAAIGTIRKYSGIAVGLIGISILAFVLTDAFNYKGYGRAFLGNKNAVGYIAGNEISYPDFNARVEMMTEKYKKNNNVENISEGKNILEIFDFGRAKKQPGYWRSSL